MKIKLISIKTIFILFLLFAMGGTISHTDVIFTKTIIIDDSILQFFNSTTKTEKIGNILYYYSEVT